jgi:hypothetical protein
MGRWEDEIIGSSNSGVRLAILELSKIFLKISTTFSFNFKSFFLHANPREVGQID